MNYEEYFRRARAAVGANAGAAGAVSGVDATLMSVADALIRESDAVLAANELDLARMDPEDPRYDRLKLTKERIVDIATDMRKVSSLPNVLDVVLEERVMPNGLRLSRVSVPLGVVGIIYEARPNVTADAWSLCFKTGNVVLLKGGSDAEHSNAAIVRIIQSIAGSEQVQLLPSDRAATEALLQARGYVDIVIPRGSQGLIDYVRDHARVPVIETGAGVVHTYLDETADASMAARVIENAKTRRVSVCNALDCLLVHRNRLGELLELLAPLAAKGVEIRADAESHAALAGRYERLERADDFGTEFLSLKLSVKTVGSLEEALAHIRTYGSGHSEAILTGNAEHAEKFVKAVDAAAVYVNTSTAFTDGGQFGLGAEIGISTQKLHARGPMGLEALTSYKWIVRGDGQVRP